MASIILMKPLSVIHYHVLINCMALLILSVPSYANSDASIQTPGPDLANYPNSAFTLPQYHSYVEMSAFYNNKSLASSTQYNVGYLLRYGLTDNLELRLQSNGFTMVDGTTKQLGISPQVFDIKWHIMNAPDNSLLPALGIEASVQTEWASPAFKSGIQPALSLNFDHALAYDISIEYNIGFISQQTNVEQNNYKLALSWAVQRNIINNVAVFIHGYSNTANGVGSTVIGGGLQWTLSPRVAVFANANTGLTIGTASFSSLLGLAIAF
ncbi:MAG: transporter [Methylococcaceae bacterium]